ncbi:MAG: amino acid adenylation domain-containing protein [Acidobacteriota bacterium]|nr:MAG: amino acid adenylation domain-containing protein [Acidobacteriota bacterium]
MSLKNRGIGSSPGVEAVTSFGQERLWILEQLRPASRAHRLCRAFRILHHISEALAEEVLREMVNRHEILRTTFRYREGGPLQFISSEVKAALTVIDLREVSKSERDRELNQAIRSELSLPFDLSAGPLFRTTLLWTAADETVILLHGHHIVFDGPSLEIALREIVMSYLARDAGKPSSLPELALQYRDFAEDQRLQIQGDRLEWLTRYWKQRLTGVPVLELPLRKTRPRARSFEGALFQFEVPPEIHRALLELGASERASLFATLMTVWKVLLARYSQEEDVAVRTPVSLRGRSGLESLIGFFVNTLVIRSDLSGNPPFRALLRQVQEAVLQARAHQDLPFELLVRDVRSEQQDLSRPVLAQHGLVFNRLPGYGNGNELTRSIRPLEIDPGIAMLDLTAYVWAGERLTVSLEFRTDLFDRAFIEGFAGHFKNLLVGVASDPDCRILALPLLDREERKRLLESFGRGEPFDQDPIRVDQRFEQQAKLHPKLPAVQAGSTLTSYSELNDRVNRLAALLNDRGVTRSQRVGIYLERSLELVYSVLAVLRTGAAWVPLDPSLPELRLSSIIEDCRPVIILSKGAKVAGNLQSDAGEGTTPEVIFIDEALDGAAPRSIDHLEPGAEWEDPAYLIYTSGSGGTPKGVEVSHLALANHMQWMQQEFRFSPSDVVLQRTSLSFDASIWELFAPLLSGGCLVLANPRRDCEPGYLVELIRAANVTTLQMVPSLLRFLVQEKGLGDCTSLKRVFSGGEVLPAELVHRFREQNSAKFYNLYGPTETCIDATWYECSGSEDEGVMPLGRPIHNMQALVLDSNLSPVPTLVSGELCLAGKGLANGYLGLPERNLSLFVPHPFGPPGARLYRTGDRARFREDGLLEFRGRVDRQIKIGGVRVEPAEIEAALLEFPSVSECVVVPTTREGQPMKLAAFLVGDTTRVIPAAELRRSLRLRLPSSMIPSHFVQLEVIPKLPGGKIDYQALPAAEGEDSGSRAPSRKPGNQVEESLMRIWEEILGVEVRGIDDDFFDLGGASIQVIQVAVRAEKEGFRLRPEWVFEFPTIAGLGARIQAAQESPDAEWNREDQGFDHLDRTDCRRFEGPAAATVRSGLRSVIESLGVYLPPKVVSTDEIIRQCRSRVRLPLSRLTGIDNRRMAGEDEFSIDLARRAIEECLQHSKYCASDIDLIVSCCISRYDDRLRISYEPSTAIKLKAAMGFDRAVAFDITNACAGMFTGILLADTLIRQGVVNRALLVSGEYITHLTQTAQLEIQAFLDSRLACLTLGDAGAAVLLERCEDERLGFHAIDLCTFGDLSSLCVAKATSEPHGGAIMHTDMMKVTETATRNAMLHTAQTLRRSDRSLEDFDYLITHQTSRNALRGAATEINRLLGVEACREENLLDNLAERGNTASTSHFVTLWDKIQERRIHSDRNVLFSITGSGQTIGTALYQLDDLPDRLRRPVDKRKSLQPVAETTENCFSIGDSDQRVRILNVGLSERGSNEKNRAVAMAVAAAECCLEDCCGERQEIGLVIHSGVYRDEFLTEPALAAFLAGELRLNASPDGLDGRRTLALDLMNGPVGVMNSCLVASRFILEGRTRLALITTSEIENNLGLSDRPCIGLLESGSALLLCHSGEENSGFGAFCFRDFPSYIDLVQSYVTQSSSAPYIVYRQNEGWEEVYLECIERTVQELLDSQGISSRDLSFVVPPFFSRGFVAALADRLKIDQDWMPSIPAQQGKHYTAALAAGFRAVLEQRIAGPGELGLLITVSPGVQVGCALYYL